jgi:hypothetical protein
MKKIWTTLRQNFWPISALIFCPCHLPLSMSAIAGLTAGTFVGAYISAHYNTIETVLAVAFSFYFVLAFMIWVVRGPQDRPAQACTIGASENQRPAGLSTWQIIFWGVIGMLAMPALITASLFTRENFADGTVAQIFAVSPGWNSGLIWLISISTVVMIPVMVIWLVWMWLAWSKQDFSETEVENWSYEYE